ncbi:MAG: 2-phospho-L-lactate guanylyltransferase [Propionibacteriales bacterium]|nr:2-phospho-L-lactate guanylyltransferase [Propionibacteriales bacterium]
MLPTVEPARASWTLLIPVKQMAVAKSRLVGLTDRQRQDLAMAFAMDTITAARACTDVTRLLVVTNHPDDTAFRDLGADIVADVPGVGLNAALVHGEHVVRRSQPRAAVAALAGDLPALRPADLGAAFSAAADSRYWFVADSAGTGTTLLAAAEGHRLNPAFGSQSRVAHRAGGAAEVTVGGIDRLRRDVDTAVDLREAVRLGVGVYTAKVLAGLVDGGLA